MNNIQPNVKVNSVVQVNGLSKSFQDGKRKIDVLNNVQLDVKQGELVSIIGASGSGKSTLLQLLGGLDVPTAGSVLINGTEIHKLNEKQQARFRNKNLGFVYQFHHLLSEFSALENVAMPCLLAGDSIKDATNRALELIETVGLLDRSSHKPGELSGGERQRIAFARALATQPGCIFADEPTGNLDHKTATDVFEWLLTLNQKYKTSFILVTHDKNLAKQTDRTLELLDGTLHPA
jgi:lipoprotein-releasing system ATP-binding protein